MLHKIKVDYFFVRLRRGGKSLKASFYIIVLSGGKIKYIADGQN